MNWLKAEFVKRRYGFNSPVLWTPHIRCFNHLRFRKNVILTSISVGIGHISQKGWGQDWKSQRGRGDTPGTSAGTLAAVTVVSSGPPLAERPLESFALCAFYTLQVAVLRPSGWWRHHLPTRWGWWSTQAKCTQTYSLAKSLEPTSTPWLWTVLWLCDFISEGSQGKSTWEPSALFWQPIVGLKLFWHKKFFLKKHKNLTC